MTTFVFRCGRAWGMGNTAWEALSHAMPSAAANKFVERTKQGYYLPAGHCQDRAIVFANNGLPIGDITRIVN